MAEVAFCAFECCFETPTALRGAAASCHAAPINPCAHSRMLPFFPHTTTTSQHHQNSPDSAKRVQSQLCAVIRPMYSSPPIHGAAIVVAVLSGELASWCVCVASCIIVCVRLETSRPQSVCFCLRLGGASDIVV